MLASALLLKKKGNPNILELDYEGINGSQNFIDSGNSRKPKSVFGSTVISTARAKYGASSGLFQGSTSSGLYYDYATYPELQPGLQDYTLETYCYLPSITTDNGRFLCMGTSANSNLYINFHVYNGANLWLGMGNSQNGPNLLNIYTSDGSVPSGAWFHMAMSRQANTYRIFLNGILKASASETTKTDLTFGSSSVLAIGCMFQGNYNSCFGSINGNLDKTILTIGTAKYTSNFTPA